MARDVVYGARAHSQAVGGRGPAGRWRSIQYLRALAALMVVAHHALAQLGLDGGRNAFLQGGVDVFFVISGFIIWRTTADAAPGPLRFLGRRLLRIAPLYWLLTSLVLAVVLVAPQLLQTTRFDPAHVAASYLFAAWPNPAPGVGLRPLMIPGWTLNYEVFFYGLFALALLAPRRVRAVTLLAGLGGLAALGLLIPEPAPLARFYTSPLLVEFGLGVGAALVLGARPAPPAAVCGLLVVLGAAALAASAWSGGDGWRLVQFGLPAAALVFGLAGLEAGVGVPRLAAGLALGDASYALYLVHPLLLSALAQAWRAAGLGEAPPALFLAAALLAATAGGLAVHHLVERPMARLQRGVLPRAPRAVVVEAAP